MWDFAKAQAVVPPPAGGYPSFTTAAGEHALLALTTGRWATQQLVLFRCLASPPAASTPLLALERLILTPRIQNTATGAAALLFNTTGTENTANGTAALEFNDIPAATIRLSVHSRCLATLTGDDEHGQRRVSHSISNTTGGCNTATGYQALSSNTTGNLNTATGVNALSSTPPATFNTASGLLALQQQHHR